MIQKKALLIGCVFLLFVQRFEVLAQNYTVLGNASQMSGCDCFMLTPNANNQAGAIFQNQTINLNNSFDYTFSIFLGCNNGSGADGITFALTSNPQGLGNRGEGLGYAGTNQPCSFAVEFDTYTNSNVNDPSYHHIAFNSNGQYNHNVAGPVPALPNSGNLDNCQNHTARVVWDVNSNTFSVYLNGNLRLSTVIPDIVNSYFCGNPIVNWGWTGATGGGTNEQRVCVESISSWVAGVNYQSCSPTIQFTDVSTSNVGSIQSWAWNFGDGNTSSQQNPVHTYSGIGTYNVTLVITNISGCAIEFSRPVTIVDSIIISSVLNQPPCNGGSNGSIITTASSGFGAAAGYGGYSYIWSNGTTQTDYVGASAGTYTVTVTDGVCTTTGQYTLSQPTPLTATTTSTAASCGLNNGSVSISISGGTPPYQNVNWAGVAGATRTGLAPGTYIADFTDANGCSALLQYRETVGSLPCGINASTSSTNVRCFGGNNGTATLTVTGGSPPANITWNHGPTGATVTGLSVGTYTYNYSDANPANAFSGSITISQPPAAISASITTLNTSCAGTNDGSAIVSVSSGGTPPYSYNWSINNQNNPVNNGLSAGAISVTVTDNAGCIAVLSGNITGPPTLTLNIVAINDSCYQSRKGSATANVTGGTPPYTYYWDNISPAQTNLDLYAGTYNVTVTDDNGCTISGSTTITEPTPVSHTLTVQDVLCYGNSDGSILINTTGGTPAYTYNWSPASVNGNNPVGLAAGTYFVTISDANSCETNDTISISEPATPLSVVTTSTDVTCNGLNNGSLTIIPDGGTSPYSFMGNQIPSSGTTLQNLPPGIYSGNVEDANGCLVSVNETISEPDAMIISETHTNVTCYNGNDGSITISVSGGITPYNFVWDDGIVTQNRNSLSAGTYTLLVNDSNSCTESITIELTQPDAITFSINTTEILCYGDSGVIEIVPDVGGNYTYNWQPAVSNSNISGLVPAGTFSISILDDNNCTYDTTVTLTQPDLIQLSAVATDISCFGAEDGAIAASVSGGLPEYEFSTENNGALYTSADGNFNNLPPGIYEVSVSDNNSCTTSATVNIVEPNIIQSSITASEISCYGYSNGSATVSINGGVAPYTYIWNVPGNSEFIDNLPEGTYHVTVTDGNGCSTSATVSLIQPAPIWIRTGQETYEIKLGEEVLVITESFTNNVSIADYIWTPSEGLDCNNCESTLAAPVFSTVYTVSMADENGCVASTTFTVEVSTEKIIYIPNAFTPNGDGINDMFVISALGVVDFGIKIFDRWGSLMFSANDINNHWDGTFVGKELKPGVYVYHVNASFLDGSKIQRKGSITLIR